VTTDSTSDGSPNEKGGVIKAMRADAGSIMDLSITVAFD
jgi:hypothetical protein